MIYEVYSGFEYLTVWLATHTPSFLPPERSVNDNIQPRYAALQYVSVRLPKKYNGIQQPDDATTSCFPTLFHSLPLGMKSLQSFFIFLVHLFMQSENSCRSDETEDVMFGLGLYEFFVSINVKRMENLI
jgi:hypothetical protein